MLYLDSSALIKRYIQEGGSQELAARLRQAAEAGEAVAVSLLSFAEIHAVLARKVRERTLTSHRYRWVISQFESDWRTNLTPIELSPLVLELIPDLVKKHPLKASDAIQLASALWVAKAGQPEKARQTFDRLIVFATADRQLAAAAKSERLELFNPEVR